MNLTLERVKCFLSGTLQEKVSFGGDHLKSKYMLAHFIHFVFSHFCEFLYKLFWCRLIKGTNMARSSQRGSLHWHCSLCSCCCRRSASRHTRSRSRSRPGPPFEKKNGFEQLSTVDCRDEGRHNLGVEVRVCDL